MNIQLLNIYLCTVPICTQISTCGYIIQTIDFERISNI